MSNSKNDLSYLINDNWFDIFNFSIFQHQEVMKYFLQDDIKTVQENAVLKRLAMQVNQYSM